jgi:allantoin racemase
VHITVINPNTTRAMTDMIGSCARGVAAPGTRITAVNPPMGPASIESHYDEALSVPGLLHEIAAAEGGPVVGVAEAAMHAATLVGRSFSIVTSLSRTVGRAQDLVKHYGFADRCVGVYACDIPVLALDDPSSEAAQVIIDLCRETIERDKCDSIVLGCAGMAELCSYISAQIGVPVIDGVSAATKLVESLVTLGYTTSRRDEFARPLPKAYVGELAAFELAAS